MYALTKEIWACLTGAANYESILDSLARRSATVALRRERDEVMIENRLLTYRVNEVDGTHVVHCHSNRSGLRCFGVGRWTIAWTRDAV